MKFQSTLPVWGATHCGLVFRRRRFISIHAPRVGSDILNSSSKRTIKSRHFNPRSPCGERLYQIILYLQLILFQSTLPVWGATSVLRLYSLVGPISIHAPRVGSDECGLPVPHSTYISIHAPRVGSDRFLLLGSSYTRYFNPRSPCGERLFLFCFSLAFIIFQSTLPVWGATSITRRRMQNVVKFQSTLPVWGATAKLHKYFLKFYRI